MTRIIRIHSPKLTNHQVKIQHLDQTITVAKYPKEVGTPEKWPRRPDLCHTLMGALWTITPKTPFSPHIPCGYPCRFCFGHTPSTLGYIWSPPLRLILKTYQEAIAKHLLQAHASKLILFFDSILRHWLLSCFIYIFIVSQHCAFVCWFLYLANFDCP